MKINIGVVIFNGTNKTNKFVTIMFHYLTFLKIESPK